MKCPECKRADGEHASSCSAGIERWGERSDELPIVAYDSVNHPRHYTYGGIEVIDVIEAWQLGFHEANVVKYVARAKHKGNEVEDLKKARWYLERKNAKLEEGSKCDG